MKFTAIELWSVLFTVLTTAAISAVTIVVSVKLANKTAKATAQAAIVTAQAQTERDRISARIQRRAAMMITFSDYCGSMVRRFREDGVGGPEDVTIFSSRLFTYADEDEHETLKWMQDVVAEIQATGSQALREFTNGGDWEPTTSGMIVLHLAQGHAADKANECFRRRVDDLRDWVRTHLSWEDYLRQVEAEPVTPWESRLS